MKTVRDSLFLLITFFFIACSSASDQSKQDSAVKNTWPSIEQEAFISQFIINAQTQLDSAKAAIYCSCMKEKMMAKHPDITELTKMSMEDVMKESQQIAPDCLK